MKNRQLDCYSSRYLVIIGLLLVLSGCSDTSISDLERYVAKIKAKENPHVEAIPEIKQIPPYFYEVQHMRDPFKALEEAIARPSPGSLSTGTRRKKGEKQKYCPPPNPNRVRVGLELISLDTIKMIGTLETNGILWALIQSKEGTIYRLKKDDFLGEHHGKVIHISEQKIDILEQVPDDKGCWKPRITAIKFFK
ncbi:Pilus assembly protein [Beggiatoa sp. PS]|nr:Pilus assembly protein [Beggiatoa sp. PS]